MRAGCRAAWSLAFCPCTYEFWALPRAVAFLNGTATAPIAEALRREELNARPRTQSSIAIRGADENRLDAGQRVAGYPGAVAGQSPVQPGRAYRDTGIRNIVLTDSQIDHTTGLLMLREGHASRWPLWCTDSAFDDLTTDQSHPAGVAALLRRGPATHRCDGRMVRGRRQR